MNPHMTPAPTVGGSQGGGSTNCPHCEHVRTMIAGPTQGTCGNGHCRYIEALRAELAIRENDVVQLQGQIDLLTRQHRVQRIAKNQRIRTLKVNTRNLRANVHNLRAQVDKLQERIDRDGQTLHTRRVSCCW